MDEDPRMKAEEILKTSIRMEGLYGAKRKVEFERETESWSWGLGRRLRTLFFSVTEEIPFSIEFDADSGELVEWRFPGAARGGRLKPLSVDELKALATEVAQPPDDAIFDEVSFRKEYENDIARVGWRHVHDEMPVENDYLRVTINPSSGELVALARNWTPIDHAPPGGAKPLIKEEALKRAEEELPNFRGKGTVHEAKKLYAKITDDIDAETPFETIPVWLVRFREFLEEENMNVFHELAIHLYSGEVVRYNRTG